MSYLIGGPTYVKLVAVTEDRGSLSVKPPNASISNQALHQQVQYPFFIAAYKLKLISTLIPNLIHILSISLCGPILNVCKRGHVEALNHLIGHDNSNMNVRDEESIHHYILPANMAI